MNLNHQMRMPGGFHLCFAFFLWLRQSVRAMNLDHLTTGLIFYLCFIISLSFHECAHAWMAARCGDDTAKMLGRLTLNPMAHIDMLGTVIIPLAMIFLPASVSCFIVGWAKPVPVNPLNFRHFRRDDNLVSLAGPLSNFLLGFIVLAIARILFLFQFPENSFMEHFQSLFINLAFINILLAWFNLIPIPPLDGSHLLKNFTHMDLEMYAKISRYGILILILALNFTPLSSLLSQAMVYTFSGMTYILWF